MSPTILTLLSLSLQALRVASHCLADDSPNDLFAPVAASALGVPLNSDGYAVQSFGGGAYMVTEGFYQSFFLSSTKGVILVDAPPTIGHRLQWAIGNVTNLPVKYFIYSHAHGDHAGGASRFINKPGVTSIAHENTKFALEAGGADPARPLPQVTFSRNHTVTLGNQTLELSWKGPNHDNGNIFIWAPAQKVLTVIDVVFPGWVPFDKLAVSSFIPGYVKAHDQILAYPFEHYIGGHVGRAGTRQDVETQREYIQDLFTNCKAAIQLSATNDTRVGAGSILTPTMTNNRNNAWAEFSIYLNIVSEFCHNMTSEKWLGKLAAQDVFGFSNAYTVVESLRIDFDVLGPFGPN